MTEHINIERHDEDQELFKNTRRPRDKQRSKVYRAENAFFSGYPEVTESIMIDMVDLLNGTSKIVRSRTRTITIEFSKTRRSSACGIRMLSTIRFGKYTRWDHKEWIVLHEIAHIVTSDKYAAHGREFMRNYIALVAEYYGDDIGIAFESHMRESGIDIV